MASAKQIAWRKKFAKMAKSGKFKKSKNAQQKKIVKKKHAETFTESPEKQLRASFTDWQEAMYDKIKSKKPTKSAKSNRKREKSGKGYFV